MRNFLKKVGIVSLQILSKAGIGSIRLIYSVSNKALKLGLGVSIAVLALPTSLAIFVINNTKNILKLKSSDETETDSDKGPIPLHKVLSKIVLSLYSETTADFSFGLATSHTTDSNNPFALTKSSGSHKTLVKIEVFLGSSMNIVVCSGLAYLVIHFLMGPYALDFICLGYLSYPRAFMDCLNLISFIRNTSKNLLVAFELDDKKLLQHFLNKDIPKLERTIMQRKYEELELDRFANIVDFYLLPKTQTPSVPYSREELLYLRKLYDFAVTSDMRLYEDSILRQEIDKHIPLPNEINNLILSYASDYGTGKYDNNQPRKYIADPKVVKFRDAGLKLLSFEEVYSEENKIKKGSKSKKKKVRI